jgi:hypothetical protein
MLRIARKARGARGIVAEILFYREAVKKIEAESLVFCGQGICGANSQTAKNAPKFRIINGLLNRL